MSNVLFRRRDLGYDSCNAIQDESTTGLIQLRNDRSFPPDTNLVFRWGCTSNVPSGATTVNSAVSIHRCFDKKQSRMDMQRMGISVPVTWDDHRLVPSGVGEVIFRPSNHARSENLFVIDTNVAGWGHTLTSLTREFPSYYISKRIKKVAEYRVAIVQNRVIWVLNKIPRDPNEVSWGCVETGDFDNVRWGSWPMRVVEEAMKAARYSKTDFCAVDVLVDAEGVPYVLEINTAPHIAGYHMRCFAKAFDFIVVNGKNHFDDPTDYRGWRTVIHPALQEAT